MKTQVTQHDLEERYRWEWRLRRGLYEWGFSREDVVALFHFLDWLMRLPAELEQQLYVIALEMPWRRTVRLGWRK